MKFCVVGERRAHKILSVVTPVVLVLRRINSVNSSSKKSKFVVDLPCVQGEMGVFSLFKR